MRANAQVLVIDLVRFVCALLVVGHHFGTILPLMPPAFAAKVAATTPLVPWTWAGWVGVEIFFVVSGYVIATSASGGRPGLFLRRRILRLAPAAWIAASLTAAVGLLAGIAPSADLLTRWSTSVSFAPLGDQIDPSYWTLGVEISFYLLMAGLIATPWGARAIGPLALVLAIASLWFWTSRGGLAAPANHHRLIELALLPHGAFFAIGIALRGIALGGITPMRGLTLVAGLTAGILEIVAQTAFMAAWLRLDVGPGLPLAVFGVGVGAIAAARPLQPWLAARLGVRRLGFMGVVTYPLYLIHQIAGMIVIVGLLSLGVNGAVAIVATTGLALLVASVIAAKGEPALRRWLAARLDALSPSRVPAPGTSPIASPPAG